MEEAGKALAASLDWLQVKKKRQKQRRGTLGKGKGWERDISKTVNRYKDLTCTPQSWILLPQSWILLAWVWNLGNKSEEASEST